MSATTPFDLDLDPTRDPLTRRSPMTTTRPAVAPPSLVATTSVVSGGHLSWLGWTWLVASVVFAVIITMIIRVDGVLEETLWMPAMASWQRYVIFAAGVTTLPTFLAMFVSNGVTRSQLSASSTVSMLVVAVCGTAFAIAGFVIESFIFDAQGWNHVIGDGTPVESGGAVAVLALRYLLLFSIWFAAGWVIGAMFYRFGFFGGVASIIPAAIPVLLCEVLVGQGSASITIDVLVGRVTTPAAPAVLVGIGLVAACATVARAITQRAAVRSL
jgi:hypothetical protein